MCIFGARSVYLFGSGVHLLYVMTFYKHHYISKYALCHMQSLTDSLVLGAVWKMLVVPYILHMCVESSSGSLFLSE